MQEYLAAGLLLGAAAGFAPGPLLALVISETLAHGARAGARVAVAPLLTDLPIIALTLGLLAGLARHDAALGLLSLAGAALVLRLGWESLRARPPTAAAPADAPRSLRRGVLVNALSPHPWLFWIGVGGPLVVRAWDGPGWPAAAAFLAAFYALLVGAKLLLAWLAGHARALLRGGLYRGVMAALGLLLWLFAALLVRDGLALLGWP